MHSLTPACSINSSSAVLHTVDTRSFLPGLYELVSTQGADTTEVGLAVLFLFTHACLNLEEKRNRICSKSILILGVIYNSWQTEVYNLQQATPNYKQQQSYRAIMC